MKTLKKHIEDKKSQHQGSLHDQLKQLYNLANKNGLYDAADFIKTVLEKK